MSVYVGIDVHRKRSQVGAGTTLAGGARVSVISCLRSSAACGPAAPASRGGLDRR
jgi:hypothetical protein